MDGKARFASSAAAKSSKIFIFVLVLYRFQKVNNFFFRLTNQSGYIHDGFGNYSVDVKCSWLIDVGGSNSTIRLHIEEFSTECGWDYLYIFDGDSVHSPLVAVLRYVFCILGNSPF